MTRMRSLIFTLVFVGASAPAVELRVLEKASCVAHLGPVMEPEVLDALQAFPIAERPWDEPWQRVAGPGQRPEDRTYAAALESLPPEVQAAGFESINGGLANWPVRFDLLIGRAVVGLFDSADQLYGFVPPHERSLFYAAGRITGVKRVWPVDSIYHANHEYTEAEIQDTHRYYQLTVLLERDEIEVPVDLLSLRPGHLKLLGPAMTPKKSLERAFKNSRYDDWITASFGAPAKAQDFAVAEQATRLLTSLPPQRGVPTVINILRGRRDAYRGHELYGSLAGHRRYTPAKLETFLRYAEQFMQAQGVTEVTSVRRESHFDVPERRSGDLLGHFLGLLRRRIPRGAAAPVRRDAAPVYTHDDYLRAAHKLIDFAPPAELVAGLIMGMDDDLPEGVKVRPSTLPKANQLVALSKRRCGGGTRRCYRVDLPSQLGFSFPVLDQGVERRYWADVVPKLEVVFGPGPGEIVEQKLTWFLEGGIKGSTFPVEPARDALRSVLERLKSGE